jgi:Reverse transcriptase (RNA-dependent DNA polymerase)
MAAAYLAGDIILKVDIANAFNTARRRNMFEQVTAKIPGLARYFRFQYGRASALRGNQGTIIAWSATGVGQGHPCSPLYFELAIHTALLELEAKVKEIEDEHDQQRPDLRVARKGSVTAYEDDTLIRGEADIIRRVGPLVADHFAAHGFEVKVAKSRITGKDTANMEGLPEGFVIAPTGFQVVGIPIGDPEYCRTLVAKLLEEMAPPPAALATLRPRSAYQLLSKCFNARPTYLLRTVLDWTEAVTAAKEFGDRMTGAIAATLQLPVTPELTTRIYLPRKHGGLGFTRHAGMASEKNQLCSRLIHGNFLNDHHPSELPLTQTNYNMRDIRMGTIEDIEEHTEITAEDRAGMDHKTCRDILKRGKDLAEIRTSDLLHRTMRDSPDHQSQAAWFLSSTIGGTAFMDSTAGIAYERYFGDAEFICAARMKLGVGPTNEPGNQLRVCACGKAFETRVDPFHAISCRLNHHARTYCHTDIVSLLYNLLKRRHPLSAIAKEKEVGHTVEGQAVRADIVVNIGPTTYVIDVSTVDPGNASSLGQAQSSATHQDSAALKRERTKRTYYRRVVTPARLEEAQVIPFVVETSGRLGPAAISFLFQLCVLSPFARTKFLNSVVMLVSRTNGKILKDTRDRFQQYL